MTDTRTWPTPSGSQTIHVIGDTHFGGISSTSPRGLKPLADFSHPLAPKVAAHLHVGDVVNANASQDSIGLAWLAQITDAPVYTACGNHDLWQNFRTVESWCSVYSDYLVGGVQNYIVDLDWVRVIVIGPDVIGDDDTTIPIPQDTLDWLAARLAETDQDCWVLCHAPLYNTCLGSESLYYTSIDAGFYVVGPNGTDDTEIRAVLGAAANAKAWICGHTHCDITVPGFAALTTCGTRDVAHINASALYYTGKTIDWNDPLFTLYLTLTESGDIEVRYRNHGGGVWDGPAGVLLTTLSPS